MRIERYSADREADWDSFVRGSKNGTFLLLRDYMDYHCDRFQDDSLVVFCRDKIVALLPGHNMGLMYGSHEGLTYGGFITDEKMTTPLMVEVFESALAHLRESGYERLRYKTIPYIYHVAPANEDLYCLHLSRAQLVRRNVLSVVGDEDLTFRSDRRRGSKKAQKHGLVVRPSSDLAAYWRILTELLSERYGTRPVHTLREMEMLEDRFPLNIHLYAVLKGEEMVAGTVIYESRKVARVQYTASNEEAKRLGALDLLYDVLIHEVFAYKPYFDLGSSNEGWSWQLNQGLVEYKEGLGARNVNQDMYEIDLTGWRPGQLREALV